MSGMKRGARWTVVVCAAALAPWACSDDDGDSGSAGGGAAGHDAGGSEVSDQQAEEAAPPSDATDSSAVSDTPTEAEAEAASACPADMQLVEDYCVDRFEAPNVVGALPLVMYTFTESEAWCQARGKRLCFDDEWTRSCAGPSGAKYPYGDAHQPGTCNDEESWKLYDQSKLNGWPWSVSKPNIETLTQLLDAARAISPSAKVAADHVETLYQAEPSGSNGACAGPDAVFDLCGNVEEWTRRRDGGSGPELSGSLKGRYWAESRTCQNAVTNHGNSFRFYEIGFRCCKGVEPG